MSRRYWIAGSLCLSTATAIWGGMFVVSAAVLPFIPSWVLLEMRFVLSLFVLGTAALLRRAWRVRRQDLWLLATLGLFGYALSIGMQFVGTELSGAAMGSLITAASPALIALFAAWILKERVTRMNWLAFALGLGGIIAVLGLPQGGEAAFAGAVALAVAAFAWAFYTVLGRIATRRYGSLAVTAWANVFGVLWVAGPAAMQNRAQPWSLPHEAWVWAGVLYLGVVSTAGAFYLWNKGFEYLPPRIGGLYFFVQPIVGGLLGWALLGERLSLPFFVGAALILGGLFTAVRAESPGAASPHGPDGNSTDLAADRCESTPL